MNSELNLKGHVEIFDQSGNKILDEYNMITNIGKQMILKNMFENNNANDGNMSSIIRKVVLIYSENSNSISFNNDKTLADICGVTVDNSLTGEHLSYAKMITAAYSNAVIPATGTNTTYGEAYGTIYTATSITGNSYAVRGKSGTGDNEKIWTCTFTDDSLTVLVAMSKSGDGDIDGKPATAPPTICATRYLNNNSMIVYAKITTDGNGSGTNYLSAISLAGSSNVDSSGKIVSSGGTTIFYPFTSLSFNIGQLAANTTYVIKYALYM